MREQSILSALKKKALLNFFTHKKVKCGIISICLIVFLSFDSFSLTQVFTMEVFYMNV